MQIQSLSNKTSNNTSFGLKISDNVTSNIIEQYKNLGAKDSEIAYYLRTIEKSAPDEFILIGNDTKSKIKCYKDFNAERIIINNVKVKKETGETVNAKHSDIYEYSNDKDVDSGILDYNYKAEDKVFFAENLLKAIHKAVEKLSVGDFEQIEDTTTQTQTSNLSQYKHILDMAKIWPDIPYNND